MAEKTKIEMEEKAVSPKLTEKYSKERILSSDTYKKHKDLLKVVLEDDKSYTKEDVDKQIDKYMKGVIK